MTQLRQRARRAYAAAFLKRSPTSTNLASNIVDGSFENWWITPALDALESALRMSDHDDEEGETAEVRSAQTGR